MKPTKGPADVISRITCAGKPLESELSEGFLAQVYHATVGGMTFCLTKLI